MEISEFNPEIGQQFSLLALLNSLVGISSEKVSRPRLSVLVIEVLRDIVIKIKFFGYS